MLIFLFRFLLLALVSNLALRIFRFHTVEKILESLQKIMKMLQRKNYTLYPTVFCSNISPLIHEFRQMTQAGLGHRKQ